MGFLDHSTNNILVDAVLTTEGRESLADGGFDIAFYSFGDDEIDYSIIKKYGKTVGKEKIEKNTPIFEAFTNSSIALKYELLNITPDTTNGIYYYPVGSFSGKDVENNDIVSLSTTNKTSASDIVFNIKMTGNNPIPANFSTSDYAVEVDDNLLSISNASEVISFIYPDNTRVYDLSGTTGTASSSVIIKLSIKDGLSSSSVFNLYKVSGISGATYIRTYVNVIHNLSGVRKSLEVRIYNVNLQ